MNPWFGLSGEGYLPQARFGPGLPRERHHEAWSAGGFLEIGPLRLGYSYSDERFAEQRSDPKETQKGHMAYVGLSY